MELGSPPDIVWCCAGSSHPSIFIDCDVSQFQAQMDGNYFSSPYMAHAALRGLAQACRRCRDNRGQEGRRGTISSSPRPSSPSTRSQGTRHTALARLPCGPFPTHCPRKRRFAPQQIHFVPRSTCTRSSRPQYSPSPVRLRTSSRRTSPRCSKGGCGTDGGGGGQGELQGAGKWARAHHV